MANDVAALTKNDGLSYPAYVNLSRDDDGFVLTVRGERAEDGDCGPTARICLTKEEAVRFYADAWANI